MAKFLQQILGIDEPLFSIGIHQLEKANGNSGIDTRLIADITHRAHDIMRKLGLDPADTTGEELYHTLVATVKTGVAERMLEDTDYVLLPFGDDVVSFNLIDVIDNSHHELSYGQKIASHGKRSLRGEIVERYVSTGSADKNITTDLVTEIGLLPSTDQGYDTAPYKEKESSSATKTPFMLAIGDIFTDAFIKISDEVGRVDVQDDGTKRFSIPWGSREPYESVDIIKAVGPAPNAAVSGSRLGVHTGLMAFLGDDLTGTDAMTNLAHERVDTSTVSVQQGLKTNYYYVLRMGAERTLLLHDEDYDYAWQEPSQEPDWIYLTELSPESWSLHEDLLQYLTDHPDVQLAFQPGSFHFKWGVEKLVDFYKRTHIIVVNREEAMKITGKPYDSIHVLADALHDLGPKKVVITDGPNGSYASFDGRLVTIPNYPDPAPPFDRTGAGDAFASTIVSALASGESMETALTWAPINSMSVVQKLGAQAGLLSTSQIKAWLKKAPEEYSVKDFEG